MQKYISYYYVDVADDEYYHNEYICYPHYNNTISLYKNHEVKFGNNHSQIFYNSASSPLQIFTPLRETILKVSQIGPVHKIGIVFEPFGINQVLNNDLAISERVTSPDFSFFDVEFINRLFDIENLEDLKLALDKQILSMFLPVTNEYIIRTLQLFHNSADEISIDELAEHKLGISRKHLNRLFKKHIGTSVQKYRSIVRFRQLMSHKLNLQPQTNLGILSHQAHYTDQSHFIKACKQLTGLTPSQFFKDGKIVGTEDTFWNFTG
ncbi:AraC family transcriptional regulator [Pedobacter sp. ASV28]|uniref:helix-turn-helix domain-containing protein n=1 Tax=Pedobacter sp. ASV28 TaxID=2795123 RepID=UPI0018EC1C64|nr:helix-turn-helix transcriptional regulator [Pedobacter sp. ASV28]